MFFRNHADLFRGYIQVLFTLKAVDRIFICSMPTLVGDG